ncbi:hypothetical protein CBS101457_002727 [Exobasidium rhododendri]|nr:hypothetical protein CBS101457_002727 [Exobasidium rhododendri]
MPLLAEASVRSSLRSFRPTLHGNKARNASQWAQQSGRRITRTALPVLASASFLGALGFYFATFDYWTAHADDGGVNSNTLPSIRPTYTMAGDEQKMKMISMDEVNEHNSTKKGLWVAIQGQVYDLTDFVDSHPGGKNVILKNAGKDVTDLYVPIHPANAIAESLIPSQHLGQVDPRTIKKAQIGELSEREKKRIHARENLPPLGTILNLDDFEQVAKTILSDQAWAYYSSAGDDEITKHQNRSSYSRIWFKPRILRSVGSVDASSSLITGKHNTSLPVYISPAAMAKLGHPEGELNLTRAAGKAGIVQGISANASISLDEMLDARLQGQPVFYQLYVNKDRSASEKILQKVQDKDVSAIMLTVDAPVMGNRERDMRAKGEEVETGGGAGGATKGGGVAQAISGYIDPDLSWNDIAWLKQKCSLPLILKGIQTVADVELAVRHGCQGVVLSNHGGRSLDYAPAPIDVLIELRQTRPDLFKKIEVYVDGGVRRGTDVLKALALGATAVGLGRPFLYAQSGYGEAGASRAIQILQDEIERGMRLLGVTSLSQLTPDMIDILPRSYDPFVHAKRKEDIDEQ